MAIFKCKNCNHLIPPTDPVCAKCGFNRQGAYVGIDGSVVFPPLVPPSSGRSPIREPPPPDAVATTASMKDGPPEQGDTVAIAKLGQFSLALLLIVFGIVAVVAAIYAAGAYLAVALPIAILINLFGCRDRIATVQGFGWAKTHKVWVSLVAFLVISVAWSTLTGAAKNPPPPQNAGVTAVVVHATAANTPWSALTVPTIPVASATVNASGATADVPERQLTEGTSFPAVVTSPVLSSPTPLVSPTVTVATPAPVPLTASPIVPSGMAHAQASVVLPQVHKIGDDVKDQDHIVKVLSVRRTSLLEIDVVVANDVSASGSIQAYYGCFYVRDLQGTDLDGTFPEGAAGWFDGKILPGDKLKGVLAFKPQGTMKGLKLYYRPCLSALDQTTVVIGLDTDAQTTPWVKPAGLAAPQPFMSGSSYKVGDAVALNGLVVKLLDGTFSGNTFVGTVLLYNGSNGDVQFRVVDAFEVKDSDGNQARFDVHHDVVTGSIVSGDALRVPLYYVFATTTGKGVQLYFRSDLIGDTALRYLLN